MKIEARCETCDRRFLLSQIGPESDAPGRCPFCGARFGRHYTSLLTESVRDAEGAFEAFVHALNKLRSMNAGFELDVDGVFDTLSEQIRGTGTDRAAS